jgi:hypothetical protein
MSVLGLLSNFATHFKVKHLKEKPVVDNAVFRLHYRFTAVFFLAASVLITAVNFFGKPIVCTADKFPRPDMLDTYCWIQQTFTYPIAANNQSDPGVGPDWKTIDKRTHSYYQWVPFVLFFQGLLFYFPHWMWKNQEGGLIGRLTEGGRRGCTLQSGKNEPGRRPLLSDYLNQTMGTRGYLGVAHVTCELLNLVNAMGNIYLIDLFLGGCFFDYGWQVLTFTEKDQLIRHDPMIRIFPRVTKCKFDRYGPSGTQEIHDALCILPLNVLNEKIYIFAWFWLVFLSMASVSALIYRSLVVISTRVRLAVFKRIGTTTCDPDSLAILSRRLPYSDCYLLLMLGKNLDGVAFRDLLDDLAHHFDHSHLDC